MHTTEVVISMVDTKDRLVAAFRKAADAHAFAYVQVDGADPDWAYWYADILQQPLSEALKQPLTRAQIVVCLTEAEDDRLARFGAGHPWPEFYADQFLTRYMPAAPNAVSTMALYYYPECPYCQRVLRAINETGATVELRHIWNNPVFREELQAARGRTTVPVLRITSNGTERWMPESADIVRYLRERAASV